MERNNILLQSMSKRLRSATAAKCVQGDHLVRLVLGSFMSHEHFGW